VNLAVSDGLGSRIVEVPDVVGLRLSEAQQTITKAGLRVGEVRFQPSREFTPNTVISFSPDAEELTEGESLQLVVAERFDAREEVESGAIIDDSTSVNQQNQNMPNQQ
jgi:beta-lactam-binding protein with PASTA domain